MKILDRIKKWCKRKTFDLRQAGIDKYTREFGEDAGQEFGEMYDLINEGESIGGLYKTIIFLNMLEEVKKDSGFYD